jgi:glycosyltransferase involved in cell wall biosynthesis
MTAVDVLIPTYNRPAALAATLACLIGQTFEDFAVVVSDQSDAAGSPEPVAEAVLRVLRARGRAVQYHRHLPRRGMAEQRQFLLDQASAPYALYIDDDVLLAPRTIARLHAAIVRAGCGLVGCGLIGLRYDDVDRPEEEAITFWDGPVTPEDVGPETAAWQRYRLHNAANLHHLARRLHASDDEDRLYKIAWAGGCTLFDVAKLRAVGGFGFWRDLPAEHVGEEVLAQQRVIAAYGGCGLFPSGAYHQDLPTTIVARDYDLPKRMR